LRANTKAETANSTAMIMVLEVVFTLKPPVYTKKLGYPNCV